MKIGFDARLALYEPHGITRQVINVLKELEKLDNANSYILYTNKKDVNNVLPQKFEKRLLSPSSYFLWEQIALPLAAKRDKVDILHCPGNTAPVRLSPKIKLVMTIHDLMFMDDNNPDLFPGNLYQRLGKYYRKLNVSNVVHKAAAIITVSQYSRKEFYKYFPRLQTPVSVAYVGCEFPDYSKVDNEFVLRRHHIKKPFILSFGGIAPRKNTKRVIEIFSRVREKYDFQLVITGIPSRKRNEYEQYAIQNGVKEDTIFLPLIPESELVVLLRNAKLFLFLSKYEGFGLPVLEAMSCKVPVIASNRTSIPEIVGDKQIMVNPDDENEVINLIFRMLQLSEEDRAMMCEKNKNWSDNFTWERTASQVLSVYNSLHSG